MILKAAAQNLPFRDNCVQCVVTSPAYWGLRKYAGKQEFVWGGAEGCGHEWGDELPGDTRGGSGPAAKESCAAGGKSVYARQVARGNICHLCGAWRGAFGLEPTIEMYVQHSVEILREARRVLRPDGVCFYNIGDSYASVGGKVGRFPGGGDQGREGIRRGFIETQTNRMPQDGLKPKDLCLIPARVALAAQADGWWVRSDIIWNKRNPMPESVRDRPTDAYEHILMLTKSARYYWNAEAVKERALGESEHDLTGPGYSAPGQAPSNGNRNSSAVANFKRETKDVAGPGQSCAQHRENREPTYATGFRNLRNVWTFATQPYKGAHFATFPAELVIRCLQAATKPGDLVLDPFGGSGTVGQVAFNMVRRFILSDLAYQDLQRDRIPPMAFVL